MIPYLYNALWQIVTVKRKRQSTDDVKYEVQQRPAATFCVTDHANYNFTYYKNISFYFNKHYKVK